MSDIPEITAAPQAWEFEPVNAMARCDFSLMYQIRCDGLGIDLVVTPVLIHFKRGEVVFGKWVGREYADPKKLSVDFEKMGFAFRLSADDFFKLFKKS